VADDAREALLRIARVLYWHLHNEPYGSEGRWPTGKRIENFIEKVSKVIHEEYQSLFLTAAQEEELARRLRAQFWGLKLYQFQLDGKEMDPETRRGEDNILVARIKKDIPDFEGPAFREEHLDEKGKSRGPKVISIKRLGDLVGDSEPTLRTLDRDEKKPYLQPLPPKVYHREVDLMILMEALGFGADACRRVADVLFKSPPLTWKRAGRKPSPTIGKRWASRLLFWKR